MNCCQSAPRSMRITAEATAVRSRPGDAVKVHGAARIEPFDRGALQRRRDRRGVGDDGDADIGFEQLDQVAFRGDLVAALDVEPVFAQRSIHPVRMFAVVSRQQLLGPEIADVDGVAAGQGMPLVDDELEVFGEQRPGIEPVPVLADFGGDAEFGLALLQIFADLAALPRRKRNSSRLNCRLIWSRCGISSERSIEWVSAILSAPTSPLLKEEASTRAPLAAS